MEREKPDFLSEAQWTLLVRSYDYQGRAHASFGKVVAYREHPRTLEILTKRGLIAEDFTLRRPTDRADMDAQRDAWIARATAELAQGDWHMALRSLQRAEECRARLAEKTWWLSARALALLGHQAAEAAV